MPIVLIIALLCTVKSIEFNEVPQRLEGQQYIGVTIRDLREKRNVDFEAWLFQIPLTHTFVLFSTELPLYEKKLQPFWQAQNSQYFTQIFGEQWFALAFIYESFQSNLDFNQAKDMFQTTRLNVLINIASVEIDLRFHTTNNRERKRQSDIYLSLKHFIQEKQPIEIPVVLKPLIQKCYLELEKPKPKPQLIDL